MEERGDELKEVRRRRKENITREEKDKDKKRR
jgi:hypothetical protein